MINRLGFEYHDLIFEQGMNSNDNLLRHGRDGDKITPVVVRILFFFRKPVYILLDKRHVDYQGSSSDVEFQRFDTTRQ